MDNIKVESNVTPGAVLVFEVRPVKRKGQEGSIELTPEVQELSAYVSMWGEDKIRDIVHLQVVRNSRKWMNEATDEKTGVFDKEDYIRMAQGFSARGETIKDIQERMVDLVKVQMVNLFKSKLSDDPQQDMKLKFDKAQAITAKVQALQQAIAEKKRLTEEDKAAQQEEAETPTVV